MFSFRHTRIQNDYKCHITPSMRFCLRKNLSESKLSVTAALVRSRIQTMRTGCLPAGLSVRVNVRIFNKPQI